MKIASRATERIMEVFVEIGKWSKVGGGVVDQTNWLNWTSVAMLKDTYMEHSSSGK